MDAAVVPTHMQLIMGIGKMHQAGVCHRDLKVDNLALDSHFNIKAIDFGFACDISGTNGQGFCQRGTQVGTPGYMAPEIHLGAKYQPIVADMFSLGVIIFILYAGYPPFTLATVDDPYYKAICNQEYNYFW